MVLTLFGMPRDRLGLSRFVNIRVASSAAAPDYLAINCSLTAYSSGGRAPSTTQAVIVIPRY